MSARDAGRAYAIPAGNPLAGAAEGRTEIWALGLRNPWRFSFDRATGDLWVGQTDEGELGFTYADVDRLLVLMVDRRWRRAELVREVSTVKGVSCWRIPGRASPGSRTCAAIGCG